MRKRPAHQWARGNRVEKLSIEVEVPAPSSRSIDSVFPIVAFDESRPERCGFLIPKVPPWTSTRIELFARQKTGHALKRALHVATTVRRTKTRKVDVDGILIRGERAGFETDKRGCDRKSVSPDGLWRHSIHLE
jgi:hypothetical protein